MKNNYFIRTLLLFFAIISCSKIMAGNTYYYKATATVNNEEIGKVFLSTEKKDPQDSDYKPSISIAPNSEDKSLTVYGYTKAESSTEWHALWVNNESGDILASSQIGNEVELKIVSTSTEENNPTLNDMTVYFSKVDVKTEDKTRGNVSFNYSETDQTITIKATAVPLTGYVFEGWSLNGNEELITDNPYTISEIGANDVYEARFKFTPPYYRVQNTYYKNYMSLIDDKADQGATTNIFLDLHAIVFKNSYEDVASDPGSIFYIQKISDINHDLVAQGKSLNDMTGEYIQLTPYTTTNGLVAYKAGLDLGIASGVLQEVNGVLDAGKGDGSEIKWGYYIIPVDKNSDNYFGVNAKLEYGGKYYTTLYAGFPFKLPEDKSIRAYYVKNVKDGIAKCTEISGIVPGGTPVFLECNNSDASDNRLELVDPSTDIPAIEDNMMKGTYFNCAGTYYNNGDQNQTPTVDYYNRTPNNQETMRVLSKNSNGEIGFFILKSSVEYMAANKAWLEIPSGENAKSFSIMFEDGAATGISEIRTLNTEDVSSSYYYDLQGRRVENPSHGLYIHNGKKIYIK